MCFFVFDDLYKNTGKIGRVSNMNMIEGGLHGVYEKQIYDMCVNNYHTYTPCRVVVHVASMFMHMLFQIIVFNIYVSFPVYPI